MDEVVRLFLNEVGALAADFAPKLIAALVVLLVGRKLIHWLVRGIDSGKFLDHLDDTLRSFLTSFLSISLNILLFVTIAMILGVPAASFVAILASSAAAIGLALQGSLSNFAGGIMIMFFKPFKVGDFIETSTGKAGYVIDITSFYTILKTSDNKKITLPNGSLTNTPIVNYSTQERRRVDMNFIVAYDSDSDQVKAMLLDAVSAHPKVLKEPAPFAWLTAQNANSLNFALRIWVEDADYATVRFDITEYMRKKLSESGIEVQQPKMEIHMDADPSQK